MNTNEKLEWISKATSDELLIQFESAVRMMNSEIIPVRIEATADYYMIKAELMKRLGQ